MWRHPAPLKIFDSSEPVCRRFSLYEVKARCGPNQEVETQRPTKRRNTTMKLNITRNATRLTLFAAALLATILFAGSANAQSPFKGKFTLQHETRWGQAVLPSRRLHTHIRQPLFPTCWSSATPRAVTRWRTSRPTMRRTARVVKAPCSSAVRGSQQVVHSFRLAELGQTFIYDPALANRREVEEARQSQAVPVIVAKK